MIFIISNQCIFRDGKITNLGLNFNGGHRCVDFLIRFPKVESRD